VENMLDVKPLAWTVFFLSENF